MAECKIKFTREDNPVAYNLYGALIKEGVSCDKMDTGYRIVNYSRIHCADGEDLSCNVNAGDGELDAVEVIEFAMNRYEKYRKIVEGAIGRPLPWVLDDLDPTTEFDDKEIRPLIAGVIGSIKRRLKAMGCEEGSEDYKEKLAVALYYLVETPDTAALRRAGTDDDFLERTSELAKLGLDEYQHYLLKNGGLRVDGDYSEELSAIDALKKKQGECTEFSKILFAVFKMAGFEPTFVLVPYRGLGDDVKKRIVERKGAYYEARAGQHVCVGLFLKNKLRLFDASMMVSSVKYETYFPISNRQYLALDMINSGAASLRWQMVYNGSGKRISIDNKDMEEAANIYTMSLHLDPFGPMALTAFSKMIQFGKRKENDSMSIAVATKAIVIDPDDAWGYKARGDRWRQAGDNERALADYKTAAEKYRDDPSAYVDVAAMYAEIGNIEAAAANLKRALRIKPDCKLAHLNMGFLLVRKGDDEGGISELAEGINLEISEPSADPKKLVFALREYFDQVAINTDLHWNLDEQRKEESNRIEKEISLRASAFEANYVFNFACWKAGDSLLETSVYNFKNFNLKPLLEGISNSKPLSPSTKNLIERMLKLMPPDMVENEELKPLLQKLKDELADHQKN